MSSWLPLYIAEADYEFKGLYDSDSNPVFKEGMVISAHAPPAPRKQRVRTPSLVIIEFILDALPHVGTAGQMLYLSLVRNYNTPAYLHHEMVFFEVDGDCLDRQAAQMAEVVKQLQHG